MQSKQYQSGSFGLIVLKNSAAGREYAHRQNIFPPKRCSANMVCKMGVWRNSAPSFRGDFRIGEFFNTIGSVRSYGFVTGMAALSATCELGEISSLRGARMAGYPAAWQHEILCACQNFRAACERSTKNQFTVWAQCGHTSVLLGWQLCRVELPFATENSKFWF